MANCTPADGNRDGGIGHDKFYTLAQATELLDAVFGVAPSLSQKGTAVTDTVVGQINFPNGDGDSAVNFPGPPNNDDFAVRVNGLLALKAGGHVFEIPSDDGFNFYIGDYNVGTCGDGKGNSNVQFYVYVSEDGLYPFKFDYREGCCGNSLVFNEIVFSLKDLSITTEGGQHRQREQGLRERQSVPHPLRGCGRRRRRGSRRLRIVPGLLHRRADHGPGADHPRVLLLLQQEQRRLHRRR